MARVAVVGAGLVGASVAVQAQAALPPGSAVTLLADGFDEATTSWVAAGVFRVESLEEVLPGDPERAARWCRDSMRHLSRLAFSPDGPRFGVAPLPLVQVARERPAGGRPYAYAAFVPGGCRELGPDELATQFPDWPGGLQYGVECLTVLADPRVYLPRLVAQFLSAGGRIERRRLSSLEDAGVGFDLVFNCCGLGAGRLIGDAAVHPVRGQVVRVRAPWLKRGVYGPDSTYAYPTVSPTDAWATVGGVRQVGDSDLAPRDSDAADIRRRAARLLPGLAAAFAEPGARDLVGLRPARAGGVRVEAEGRVVHCYGHGGNGVALSWGTAKEAVGLGLARLDGCSASPARL